MKESEKYFKIFSSVAGQLNLQLLKEMQLETAVIEVLDCVCLKIYKKSWCSSKEDPLLAKTRIFFSIWVSDESDKQQKLLYNIHAFKLRHLPGYAIESRKFANVFRSAFKAFEQQWPNVSVNFGPLTLMEGWVSFDHKNIAQQIVELANNFLTIAPLLEDTLASFKK